MAFIVKVKCVLAVVFLLLILTSFPAIAYNATCNDQYQVVISVKFSNGGFPVSGANISITDKRHNISLTKQTDSSGNVIIKSDLTRSSQSCDGEWRGVIHFKHAWDYLIKVSAPGLTTITDNFTLGPNNKNINKTIYLR